MAFIFGKKSRHRKLLCAKLVDTFIMGLFFIDSFSRDFDFVIFVLVYFGGDVLNSLLEERLAIITKSLDEVETLKKTLEEIVVSPSVESLETDLKQKEADLDLTIQKMRMEIKDRATKEIQDLELRQKAKIKFEEDKATSQLSEQIKNLTVQLAVLQIENRVLKARADLV